MISTANCGPAPANPPLGCTPSRRVAALGAALVAGASLLSAHAQHADPIVEEAIQAGAQAERR